MNKVILCQGSFTDVGCFEIFQLNLVGGLRPSGVRICMTPVADLIRSSRCVEMPRKPIKSEVGWVCKPSVGG